MNSVKSRHSIIKKIAIFAVPFFILLYTFLYFSESAILNATFVEEIGHGYMTHNYFLKQTQFIRPSRWSGSDIDANLLYNLKSQFSTKDITIKQASDAIFIKDSSKIKSPFDIGYYDKVTNQRGSLLHVGPIRWLSPITVNVDVRWYYGVLGATWGKVVLKFNGQKWIIKDYIFEGIS